MSIFERIRKVSDDNIWKKGRKIASSNASVFVREHDGNEWELQVKDSAPHSHNVYLWDDAEEWDCDCDAVESPCEHVVAAVLALRHGTFKRYSESNKSFGYRFVPTPNKSGLVLKRMIVDELGEEPFSGTVFRNTAVKPTDIDIAIERKVFNDFNRVLSKQTLNELFGLFENALEMDVMLDGEPVKTSSSPVVPIAIVEDVENGFRVRIVRDPGLDGVYGGGAVTCNSILRVSSRGRLTDIQFRELSKGIYFGMEDVRTIVSQVIPDLEKKIPVDVRTTRLPKGAESPPYLLIDSRQEGNELVITPKVVYGDPVVAVMMGDELDIIGSFVPIRDRDSERRIKRRATDMLGIAIGPSSRFSGNKAIRMANLIRLLTAREEQWRTTGKALSLFRMEESFEPTIDVDGSDFHVDWGPADGDAVLEAWRRGDNLVQIKNGGWAPIPTNWLEEFGHVVADLLAARNSSADNSLPKYALFDLNNLYRKLNSPPPPNLDPLRQLTGAFEAIKESPLPSDFTGSLRSYQQQGVNWLHFLEKAQVGGILADDMGLGKTIQALCILKKRALVVAPTSVLHNWLLEAKRFRPQLSMCLYHGTNRHYDLEADVILTSYAILRNDIEKFKSEKWSVVVLDEAQAIKNPHSQTAQAAFSLKAEFRLALTGTPVENRLEELWSQMNFLCPGLLSGVRDFRKRFETPISNGDLGVAKRLRERIKPLVLRRLKQNVAPELPPRTEVTLKCTLAEEERKLYDAVRVATRADLVKAINEGKFTVMTALEALLRLRQAACHSGLLPNQDAAVSSKISLLIDRLMTLRSAGHKALVFSQWTQFLDRIEPHLNSNGIQFVRLDGSTRNRQSVVDAFQKENGPTVFLSSLKAGGIGLNLTAADHVFLMDPWWNPAAEDQAADRAHRIGQNKPVMVCRIVSTDTVEERILELQEKKRRIADAALGEASQAAAITKEELLAMLV